MVTAKVIDFPVIKNRICNKNPGACISTSSEVTVFSISVPIALSMPHHPNHLSGYISGGIYVIDLNDYQPSNQTVRADNC
jgi:hypothetical protein